MSTRASIVLVLAVFLSSLGCTLKVAYNYSDWLVLWWVDRYLDLNTEQKDFLSARLEVILVRHRKDALPLYESFLVQLRHNLSDELTREEVAWVFTSYEELRRDLFERFADDAPQVLSTLDDQQLQFLERRLEKDTEEMQVRLRKDSQGRLEERAEATVDWLENWVGSLTPEQEQRITQLSVALPDTLGAWVAYRRQRQQTLLRLLRAGREGENVEEPLRNWLVFPNKDALPQYVQARQAMKDGVTNMALSIDRMLTARQRQHALSELQALIENIQELAAT